MAKSAVAKSVALSALTSAVLISAGPARAADVPPACDSHQAAVTGGPLPPPESDAVVIRWLGNANFEFAHKGRAYLFDAYFDRAPRSHAIGFKAADVKKAEMPGTAFVAPLYRSPICVAGSGGDKGEVLSFKY
jgi:hypothetical protein